MALVLASTPLALTPASRTVDYGNFYNNVGVIMYTFADTGVVNNICTGTLIHERIVLTAAHCMMWFASAPAPWLHIAVSFSNDNPEDRSTWIDISAYLVHPGLPWRNCIISPPFQLGSCDLVGGGSEYDPQYRQGVIDVGLAILARPVKDIPLATLASAYDLNGATGQSMTIVGYGCGNSSWDGLRNFGTAALQNVSDNTATFVHGPAVICNGDSGGPTFYNGRVAAVLSDGDASYSYRSRTDTPVVRQWIASVIASVDAEAAALDLNQHGITGSWYESVTSGQGVEVEVFPDLAGVGTGVIQVSWFTFDASVVGGPERQRWYTMGGNAASGAASAVLAIYQNVGGNFNAAPITTATQVGTATLRFSDCDHGTLDYAFTDGTGRTGTIPLTRLTKNVTCAGGGVPPVNADFALSGNWYDPATSGQGITVEINPLSPVAFFAWYAYAPGGAAAGAAGQRWYTGQSGYTAGARTLAMTLYATTGGLFDTPTMPPPATVAVGTATLTFQSCTAATLDYAFTGGSSAGAMGKIMLQRVGPVPPGCAI